MATLNLMVPDMACSACADTITEAVQAIDASATIAADPQTKQVTIHTTATTSVVTTAIVDAGYTVEPG